MSNILINDKSCSENKDILKRKQNRAEHN